MDAKGSASATDGPITGELLSLLESGVPAGTLEPRLSRWLEEGRIDEVAARAARGLHSQLSEARRRESLLRVLYDTATDLTAIRDVEAILKAIVRRTRALVGTDLAYLSLNDYKTGESYIRVTDGATTALFRNIRMPLGVGVLGAVATGEAPSQSSDYPADRTKSHLESSDRAVEAEGVRAIMGVPLRVEGKVIGALLVADRHPHEFSSDDVALMESLGTHAAVALENARHFSEMADALAELDRAQQQNLATVRALEELSSIDRRLMEALAAPNTLPELHKLLRGALGKDVAAISPLGEPLAGFNADDEYGVPEVLAAAQESAAITSPVLFTAGGRELTLMSAVAGEQQLASLVVAGELSPAQIAVLERSALVLSVALLFERTFQDAQYRLQLELIDELLSSRPQDSVSVARRASQFGLSGSVRLVARVIGVEEDQRHRALAVLRREMEGRPGIVALHEAHLCLIEPARSHDDGGESFLTALRRHRITATLGSSEPVAGFAALASAHAEAQAVLAALLALSRAGEAADRAALGTAGMLLGAMGSHFTEQLLAAQIGPLLDYDQRRGTELTLTAWRFLESDGALAVAADSLHIHANTLRQRLQRIDAVLGEGWRRGSRTLDVHVALQLWRLKSVGRKGSPGSSS
ncbi:helix-turn-helix domain-containing protein [Sinomonas flava]|uniref:helix-turn-helix domain-containing protein n=1 Tax=Sinomonas flava TaxID=496857 RepID=UPI0039A58039